jgi:hypothetical protein
MVLSPVTESGIAVACDRQSIRRIVCRLLDQALSESEASIVRIEARKLKGVALLRITMEETRDVFADRTGDDVAPALATVRALVEEAGGTLVVDGDRNGVAWSVRLNLACEVNAERQGTRSAGAR